MQKNQNEEKDNGEIKINYALQSTPRRIQSEAQFKQTQPLKFLKAPIGYQSAKVNNMKEHKLINNFYTKVLGVTVESVIER